MSGIFEQCVGDDPVSGVIGGYKNNNGPECPECPKCKSRDTEAVWRDAVWEETGCLCNKCGHDFIKG